MQLFKSKDKFLQFTLNLESSKKFSLKQGITTTNENTLEALKDLVCQKGNHPRPFIFGERKDQEKHFGFGHGKWKNREFYLY